MMIELHYSLLDSTSIKIMSSIKTPDDIGFTKAQFFAGSLAVFGGGLLFGVHRATRRENVRFTSILSRRSQVLFALSALGWGSVLCLGSFAAAGATFSYITKVTSLQEFDTWAKGVGASTGINEKIPVTENDVKEMEAIEKNISDFMQTAWTGKEIASDDNSNHSIDASSSTSNSHNEDSNISNSESAGSHTNMSFSSIGKYSEHSVGSNSNKPTCNKIENATVGNRGWWK